MQNKKTSPSRQGRAVRKTERPQSLFAMMKCVLLALPLTVLLGALLLSFSTALLLLTPNPIQYTLLPGILCLYLTAFAGGALTTRFYGRRAPVLCGLMQGLALLLCFGVPTLFLQRESANTAVTLLLRLLIPIISLLGAFFTARKRKTRYRRAQKR